MTLFRPCIDIHGGKVKQIVGGTLDTEEGLETNFVSDKRPAWYATMYRDDHLRGGHVIMLGPGNDAAAEEALAAWPGGLQVGGGITPRNARRWIERGADKVIVTGFLFNDNYINIDNVKEMADTVGKEKLVIDLSCRKTESGYFVATNRWQTITTTPVNGDTLESLAAYCAEYLVHAADVEGRCRGIDETVVKLLADASPLPCTYAGGGRTIDDLDRIESLSNGRLDLTFGSALDIFGGNRVHYRACVAWNRNRSGDSPKNDKSVS